jgi:hypothetical protein
MRGVRHFGGWSQHVFSFLQQLILSGVELRFPASWFLGHLLSRVRSQFRQTAPLAQISARYG